MDHYAALGISPSADREAIQAAYRARVAALTAQSHVATTAEARLDAERGLQDVEAAYHVLSDPARRTAYDLEPARPRRLAVARAPEREAPPPPPQPQVRSVQWIQEADAPPLPLPKGPRKGPEGSEPLRVPLPTTAPPAEHPEPGTLPLPSTAPPEAPRDWRWIAVLAAAGFAAFLAAMAVVTSGFAPVHVSPAFGGSPAPMPTTEAPAATSQAPAAPASAEPAPSIAPVAAVPAARVASRPVGKGTRKGSEPSGPLRGPLGSQYTQYTNQAQGLSFVYPEDVLTPLGDAADGGVQTFASADGRTVVAVAAQPNTAGASLGDAFALAARKDAGREVTYKASGSRWYVVSGYEGDTLFYEKVVLGDGAFKTLRITFPRAYRAAHYDMVEAMSNSFKSVN